MRTPQSLRAVASVCLVLGRQSCRACGRPRAFCVQVPAPPLPLPALALPSASLPLLVAEPAKGNTKRRVHWGEDDLPPPAKLPMQQVKQGGWAGQNDHLQY